MREIDDVAEASSEEKEGNSSPAVKILPRDPRTSPSFLGLDARSPPISFNDVVEDVAIAAPRPAEGSVIQHEAPLHQQKGKRVAPGADEGPES
jgi:hypothetical protein